MTQGAQGSCSGAGLPFATVSRTTGGVGLGFKGEVLSRGFNPDPAGWGMPVICPANRRTLLEMCLENVLGSTLAFRAELPPGGRGAYGSACGCYCSREAEGHHLVKVLRREKGPGTLQGLEVSR